MRPHGHAVTPQNVMEIRKKSGWVLPESFGFADGGTVEEYYRDILAKIEQQKQQQQQGQGQGQGQQGQQGQQQQGKGGAHSPQGQQQAQGQQPGQNDSGQGGGGEAEPQMAPGTQPKQCGACAGDKAQTDKLREMAKQQGEQVPEGRSEIEQQANAQRTAMAIKKHVEGSGRGSVPAGLTRWAEKKLKKPKIDWRKQLRSIIAAGVGRAKGQQDFTQSKLRKRGAMLMPTMFAPTPRVAMVIDTSGSMGAKDLVTALSEAKGIFGVLQQGGATEVAISGCDSRATKPKRFKKWDQTAVSDVLVGGGGTDMGAGLVAVSATKPHITVVATDGDTDWPYRQPPGTGKVVVCLTRPSSYPTPSWATVVKAYDQKDYSIPGRRRDEGAMPRGD
jgi:hypothetical protein